MGLLFSGTKIPKIGFKLLKNDKTNFFWKISAFSLRQKAKKLTGQELPHILYNIGKKRPFQEYLGKIWGGNWYWKLTKKCQKTFSVKVSSSYVRESSKQSTTKF